MRWASRKFIVTLLALAGGAALAYLGKLDGVAAGLIGTVVSAYLASNVTQKAVAE